MTRIFPSLISADLLNLQQEIEQMNQYCVGYHLDIMDNHFAPNLIFGPDIVNSICRVTRRQLWAHLMVEKPDELIEKLLLPPGSILSFHFEATSRDEILINRLKEKKWQPSIAINPKTNVEDIFPLLRNVGQVLLMSVEPGFSGQEFLPSIMEKIDPLIGYRQTAGLNFTIGIDGGINQNNIQELAEKGIDDFAVGAAIF